MYCSGVYLFMLFVSEMVSWFVCGLQVQSVLCLLLACLGVRKFLMSGFVMCPGF